MGFWLERMRLLEVNCDARCPPFVPGELPSATMSIDLCKMKLMDQASTNWNALIDQRRCRVRQIVANAKYPLLFHFAVAYGSGQKRVFFETKRRILRLCCFPTDDAPGPGWRKESGENLMHQVCRLCLSSATKKQDQQRAN